MVVTTATTTTTFSIQQYLNSEKNSFNVFSFARLIRCLDIVCGSRFERNRRRHHSLFFVFFFFHSLSILFASNKLNSIVFDDGSFCFSLFCFVCFLLIATALTFSICTYSLRDNAPSPSTLLA